MSDRTARRRLGSVVASSERQLLAALLVLFAAFAAQYGGTFTNMANLENMGRVAAILLVVAVGQTFVLAVGGFDISVGANMGFVSTVVALRLTEGGGVVGSVAVGLLTGLVIGLVNGVLVAVLKVTPFIATLGTLTFLGGLANELSDGASVSGLPQDFQFFGGGGWGPVPSSVGITLIVLGGSWLLLSRCRVGLYVFSIGGSRETARVSGVPVVAYEIVAYAVCGLLAGIAGIMLASRVSVGQASLGQGYELMAIATAVIGGVAIGGGRGRLRGVLLGVALLSVLTTGLDIAGTNQFIQQMIIGGVLVVSVVVAQRRGGTKHNLRRMLGARRAAQPQLVRGGQHHA